MKQEECGLIICAIGQGCKAHGLCVEGCLDGSKTADGRCCELPTMMPRINSAFHSPGFEMCPELTLLQ